MLPYSPWGTLPSAAASQLAASYQSLPTRTERASSAAGAAAAGRHRRAVQLAALSVAGCMLLLCALVLHSQDLAWPAGRQQPRSNATASSESGKRPPHAQHAHAQQPSSVASSSNNASATAALQPPPLPDFKFDTSRSRWQPTILKTAARAEAMLAARGTPRGERVGRLFIPLLTSRPENVCCMIRSYSRMLGQHNPSDFVVFSKANTAQAVYEHACASAQLPGIDVFFMALDEHWGEAPDGAGARDPSLWSYWTPTEYRLMGHWRLLVPINLADMLGYRYLFQLDDDSEFTQPINTSLVAWMRDNRLLMEGNKTYSDLHSVTWGLPELTRTFLVAERLDPPGTLLTHHTDPRGLPGLFTLPSVANVSSAFAFEPPKGQPRGWDRMIINGNCHLMDIHVFFQPIVQRFLELVVASQYHYRFRWNEQSVFGMIWQLFVPASQYADIPRPPGGYRHGRRNWVQC